MRAAFGKFNEELNTQNEAQSFSKSRKIYIWCRTKKGRHSVTNRSRNFLIAHIFHDQGIIYPSQVYVKFLKIDARHRHKRQATECTIYRTL
ncbi:MAG: hypothetical protein A2928_00490 [Candidatus Taylorbacteria bacterium RIFCSPLOWO2_01_FULL_45_15b]|uniref:Uncharacterized protein n=1 Tax=Candidatus Taylorbacteria bacterium RIFCSPLOWO2_01_FULL_45_15b TaxID=1802319 RepID=A0A1G2N7N1_9BACT|nr:MAG: hypothetical protein A2928_00490 [Candidatus Taylorbacteria bacterium RIFCSPLOWO2_01_FULL_45_15b]